MNNVSKNFELLYHAYLDERFISINKDQFAQLLKIFPSLLILNSDGIVDKEEKLVMGIQASKLGYEYATDDLGLEKEENLMLIFKDEFKYLLKNSQKWEEKFLGVLKEFIKSDADGKLKIKETMQLFASASDGTSKEEAHAMSYLIDYLELEQG